MANIRIANGYRSAGTWDFTGIFDGAEHFSSGTLHEIYHDDGSIAAFSGIDLSFGEVPKGTITSWTLYAPNGDNFAQAENVTIGVAEMVRAAITASTHDDNRLMRAELARADKFVTSNRNDTIWSFSGDDTIRSGAGRDGIHAGSGADWINGGTGADKLYAGNDDAKDLVVFSTKLDSGNTDPTTRDKIFAFDRKNGAAERIWDRIDLSPIDADNELSGDQKFRFVDSFTKAGSSKVEGQIRIQDLGADVNVRIDFNGDNTTDMVIKVVGVGTLSAFDFDL